MKATRAVVLALVGILAGGCGQFPEEELAERLDSAQVVYHLGCDGAGKCADAKRHCGDDTLDLVKTAIEAKTPVAIEVEETPDEMYGAQTDYVFVSSDGSGEVFREYVTDNGIFCIIDKCGWRKLHFESLAFVKETSINDTDGKRVSSDEIRAGDVIVPISNRDRCVPEDQR
jgi:hypothetical protein